MTSIYFHECVETCAADTVVKALRMHAYAYGLNVGTIRKSILEVSCAGYTKKTTSNRRRLGVVSNISPLQAEKRKYKAYISATTNSDFVIFNSNYAAQCFFARQTNTQTIDYRIIHTQADPGIFKFPKRDLSNGKTRFNAVAFASDWSIPSARKSDLDNFISRHSHITLKYLDEASFNDREYYIKSLSEADFAIDFRWRECDASFISHALLAGIPVFYAESGCFAEHVGEYGIGIQDSQSHPWMVVNEVPSLKNEHIDAAWLIFQRIHHLLTMQLANTDRAGLYMAMIDDYFTYIREIIRSKR